MLGTYNSLTLVLEDLNAFNVTKTITPQEINKLLDELNKLPAADELKFSFDNLGKTQQKQMRDIINMIFTRKLPLATTEIEALFKQCIKIGNKLINNNFSAQSRSRKEKDLLTLIIKNVWAEWDVKATVQNAMERKVQTFISMIASIPYAISHFNTSVLARESFDNLLHLINFDKLYSLDEEKYHIFLSPRHKIFMMPPSIAKTMTEEHCQEIPFTDKAQYLADIQYYLKKGYRLSQKFPDDFEIMCKLYNRYTILFSPIGAALLKK